MTLQEKVDLLDEYHRLRSTVAAAHYFKVMNPVKTIVRKRKGNL